MKQNVYGRIRFLSALALAAGSFTAVAFAQNSNIHNLPNPRPIFARLPNAHPNARPADGETVLPTWNGKIVYKYGPTIYPFNMVGTDPATTNTATTVQAVIIPVKIVIAGRRGGSQTFDPETIPSNTGGLTAVDNTVQSPIFDSTTTYIQGGTYVGTTQYIDAYQRANFWGSVQTNTDYHLLLGGPTVLPEVRLNPPAESGTTGTVWGQTVAIVDLFWIDGQFQSLITSLGLQPDQLPIFMTYQTYLTSPYTGCCIGGYHTANGGQSYAEFTYIDQPGLFAQDVSALSHEIGEWADDPLVNGKFNDTVCGALEVGDPLEGGPNFGDYPYVLHGFTYNLQDLVTVEYFGAAAGTSLNDWFSFQGQTGSHACHLD
jgi:hypothetical protein